VLPRWRTPINRKKDEEDILYFDFELRHHELFLTEQSGGWIHRYSQERHRIWQIESEELFCFKECETIHRQ